MSSHFQVESWLNFYQVKSSHFTVKKSTSSRYRVILGPSQVRVSWADRNDSQVWWNVSQFSQFSYNKLLQSGNKKNEIVSHSIYKSIVYTIAANKLSCSSKQQHALLQVEQAVET